MFKKSSIKAIFLSLLMIRSASKVFALFSEKERRQTYWLFAGIMIMGLMQIAGIASITPFMAVVSSPEVIHTNKYLHQIYNTLSFSNENQFLFFLGMVVLSVLAIGNAFSAFVTWLLLRFTFMQGHSISKRLLGKYLSQPYIFFLNRNSAELNKNLFLEVNRVVGGVLIPGMQILTKAVVALSILGLLLVVDPFLAMTVALVLGGAYIIIFRLVRKKLVKIGKEATESGKERFKIASEALGGVKDLKLMSREAVFLKRYSDQSYLFASYEATNGIISQLPRYALETIAFGGILLMVLYLIGVKQSAEQALPLVSMYAFAAYRLMPSLQQIFGGMTRVRYNLAALDVLHSDLVQNETSSNQLLNGKTITPLSFKDKMQLCNIVFCYPNASTPAIDNLNLEIKPNTTIGFVGTTGSGKTTTVDIILGLLSPDSGKILIDGVEITQDNVRNWQKNLGYVPQSIYLTDDSITSNIAFGISDDKVDHDAVRQAAQIARLHDFITDDLPNGYETIVGERGVRLSGGQRQRIGIARALYHNPNVLIFDEATSALDGITENAIMDAIHHLSHKKTIIMIAHRLTTVKECDAIYMLEKGKVVASGTYAQLIKSSVNFRKMARVKLP